MYPHIDADYVYLHLEGTRTMRMTKQTDIKQIMRLYNAAWKNKRCGDSKHAAIYAGRCEGIAVTLEKFGYRIVKSNGRFIAERRDAR